jgi:hypothetical protein
MSHSHEVKKLKNDGVKLDDSSFGSVTIENISNRTLPFGSPSVILYPGDKALTCADNPAVEQSVAKKLIKVVDKSETKQESAPKVKKQKAEEVQVEETFETVAEVQALPSVQLTSSSNGETLNSEEL